MKIFFEFRSGNLASMSKFIFSDLESVCPKSLSELMQAMCASKIKAVISRRVLSVNVMAGLGVSGSVFTYLTVI